MNSIHNVFVKIYVLEFYRQHIILFIIGCGLLFGFMSGVEHKALAYFFVSKPSTTLFPLFFWIGYFLKVMIFFNQAIKRKENEFAYHFNLFSKRIQIIVLFNVWFYLLLPVLVYAVFLIGISIETRQGITTGLVIFYVLILMTLGIVFIHRLFNHPDPEKKVSALKRWIDRKIVKPYLLIIAEGIVRKDILTFLLIKILVILLLVGVLFLYTTESYDYRLLAMAVVIGFSGMSTSVQAIQLFENVQMLWIRNMPWTLLRRMCYRFFCIVLLGIPEMSILVGNFPSNLEKINLVLILLVGFSLPVIYNGILFIKSLTIEKFNYAVFFIAMLEVALVLCNIPLAILFSVNLLSGFMIYWRLYASYE